MIKHILLAASLALSFAAQAQLPIVDIALVANASNQVEVIIRPDGDFEQVFSSVVFTIRWQESDGVNLGSIAQDPEVQNYMGIIKSGPEHVSGPFRYQVFAGFSFVTLLDAESSWSAGQEIVLCRVNILNGSSFFALSDDAFTTSVNGSFYVSLNGENRTGEIYSFTTDISSEVPGSSSWVGPNPSSGPLDMVLPKDGPVRVELFDGAGRLVRTQQVVVAAGERNSVNLHGLMDGTYLIRLHHGGVVSDHRIVLLR